MNNNIRIVREYLESLKEDSELDVIFPTLLMAMDFRIVSTPRSSKGQSQYGKDVVAIGKGEDGVIYRWYFQLKGNAAKDINDTTFMEPDGVRESILAAKDVPFKDSGIPYFNNLPVKIVFVHNGILQENTRPQFEGFIEREFPEGGFERWDIETLTDLFNKYLYNEGLLVDEQSSKLMKKILVLMDAPGWRTVDVAALVDLQLRHCAADRPKREKKLGFASIHLLLAMILQECEGNGNLLPAKQASDVIVLKVWEWMLRQGVESNSMYELMFSRIIRLHVHIYTKYFNKLLPLARSYKGLYMPNGGETEKVMYGIRCFDFLSDMLYYFEVLQTIDTPIPDKRALMREQRDIVIDVIKNNSGFDLPQLDTQSIPILMTLKFMFGKYKHEDKDAKLCAQWVLRMVVNIVLHYRRRKMLPELYGDRKDLAKSMYEKVDSYKDQSSLLLMHLMEILAWMGAEELYKVLYNVISESGVNLQIAYPIAHEGLEYALFNHRLSKEMSVEFGIKIPKDMAKFDDKVVKKYNHIVLRTEKTRFRFLETLAHVYYKTDWFPDYLNFGHLKPEESEINQPI